MGSFLSLRSWYSPSASDSSCVKPRSHLAVPVVKAGRSPPGRGFGSAVGSPSALAESQGLGWYSREKASRRANFAVLSLSLSSFCRAEPSLVDYSVNRAGSIPGAHPIGETSPRERLHQRNLLRRLWSTASLTNKMRLI